MAIVLSDITGERTNWSEKTVQMNSQLVFTLNGEYDQLDEMELSNWLAEQIIRATETKSMSCVAYAYPGQGYTLTHILAASSLTVHTYPEKKILIMELSLSRKKAWERYREWLQDFVQECAFPTENITLPVSLRDHLIDIQEHIMEACAMHR